MLCLYGLTRVGIVFLLCTCIAKRSMRLNKIFLPQYLEDLRKASNELYQTVAQIRDHQRTRAFPVAFKCDHVVFQCVFSENVGLSIVKCIVQSNLYRENAGKYHEGQIGILHFARDTKDEFVDVIASKNVRYLSLTNSRC